MNNFLNNEEKLRMNKIHKTQKKTRMKKNFKKHREN